MASKGGTSSTCGRLPNPLRMRFFSVKEYVAVDMACEPQLRATAKDNRLGGEAKIGNCESSWRRSNLNSGCPMAFSKTTTGEARALSYPGSPTTFKKTYSAN